MIFEDEELEELFRELEDKEAGGLTLDHLFVLVSKKIRDNDKEE
jgi:Ca2+-binding EF-hand superfamily protein